MRFKFALTIHEFKKTLLNQTNFILAREDYFGRFVLVVDISLLEQILQRLNQVRGKRPRGDSNQDYAGNNNEIKKAMRLRDGIALQRFIQVEADGACDCILQGNRCDVSSAGVCGFGAGGCYQYFAIHILDGDAGYPRFTGKLIQDDVEPKKIVREDQFSDGVSSLFGEDLTERIGLSRERLFKL